MIAICNKCNAKYSIPDEKIKGKIIRIKCRKCGSPIEVNGKSLITSIETKKTSISQQQKTTTNLTQQPSSQKIEVSFNQSMDEFWTQFTEKHKKKREWYIGINEQPIGPLPEEEIEQKFKLGEIDENTLVWTEGYPDWIILKESNELGYLLRKKEAFPTNKIGTEQLTPPSKTYEKQPSSPQKEITEKPLIMEKIEPLPLKNEIEQLSKDESLSSPFFVEKPKEPHLKTEEEFFSKESQHSSNLTDNQASHQTIDPIPYNTSKETIPAGGLTPSMIPIVIKKVKYSAYITASIVFIAIIGSISLTLYLKGFFKVNSIPTKSQNNLISLTKNSLQTKDNLTKSLPLNSIKKEEAEINENDEINSKIELEIIEIVEVTRTHEDKKPKENKDKTDEKNNMLNKNPTSDIFNKMSAFEDRPIDELGGRKNEGEKSRATGLSEEQVLRIVSKNKSEIQRCYEKELRRSGGNLKEIKLNISFTVMQSGKVESIRMEVASGEISSFIKENLSICIESSIKRWVFPPSGRETQVKFPVLLTPGG